MQGGTNRPGFKQQAPARFIEIPPAGKKRPILLSSAMCTLEEVLESVDAIAQAGCKDLIVFHCTANYPTRLADVHMRAMATLRDELDVLVGYSDHTLEDLTAVAAVSFGAVAYEKHFTLDKKLPGPDHRASLEPREFRMLVETIRKTENLLGSKEKAPLTVEEENRKKLRKSIVACRNLKKGEVIDAGMVCAKRPGTGLAPKYGDSLIGKRVKRDIFKDDFILLDDIEETADGQKA